MIPEDEPRVGAERQPCSAGACGQLSPDAVGDTDGERGCLCHDSVVRHSPRFASSRVLQNSAPPVKNACCYCKRPAYGRALMNTPTFTLRIPPALRAELEKRAAADDRSLANYVTFVLSRHVTPTPTASEDPPAAHSPQKQSAAARIATAKSALAADVDTARKQRLENRSRRHISCAHKNLR